MENDELLEELRARMEITDVLHLYCRAVDRVELDLMAEVYHPGAIDEHGVYNGDAEGFVESLETALKGPGSRFKMMQHSISNIMIERDGDSAKVQSQVRAYHRREDKSGKWDESIGGRYLDRFERRQGKWKIAHRTCVFDWSRIEPAADKRWWELFDMEDQFHLGARDRGDPLYKFLEM
jgi:hypothetical protein